MKVTSKILTILFVGTVAFGCSDKETEKRIAKLEGKVAELETKSGARTAPQLSNPTPQAQIEPETAPAGPVPAIAFVESSFDFGPINEGDVVDHVFAFTNTGDSPLIISSATASCGCTVPQWPREPIAVGATGEIKVQFNSRNKPGIQNKTVTVTANTYPKINRVTIKANVLKAGDPS
ncbi:MAG: hypothetical protein ACI8QD_000104 [Cyclobacteriaceae bacterium]|jgi:hypothetical protein